MADQVSLDYGDYAQGFKLNEHIKNKYRHYFALNRLIKYFLLNDKMQVNILNIGSGPSSMIKDFFDTILPSINLNKLVLCESSPILCNDYKNQDWFKKYKSHITIINSKIEDYIDLNNNNSSNENERLKFDLIWCSHMFYHVRLHHLPLIINQLISNYLKINGCLSISVEDDDNPFIRNVFQKLKPNYNLSNYISYILNNNKQINYTYIYDKQQEISTKENIMKRLKLYVIQDLYCHPDYHKSKIVSLKDEKEIVNTIETYMSKYLKKNENGYKRDGLSKIFLIRKKGLVSSL